MRRGEVRLVDFEPASGSEAAKVRPAVIVSNDAANARAAELGRGVLAAAPLSSNVSRVLPFQVLLDAGTGGLARPSKVQAEQIRAVDVSRIGRVLGWLEPHQMAAVDRALRLHLAL